MRIARENREGGFYHIMTQGIDREKIFKESCFKELYIYFFKEAAEKYGVEIIAYCMMDNHTHILIKTDLTEKMSKMMHSCNGRYARKYNKILGRVGYVFRNRFRSEYILNQRYLRNCIVYIHNNPIKAKMCEKSIDYRFSSYREYIEGKIKKETLEDVFGKDCEYLIELNKPLEVENMFIDVDEEGNPILELL